MSSAAVLGVQALWGSQGKPVATGQEDFLKALSQPLILSHPLQAVLETIVSQNRRHGSDIAQLFLKSAEDARGGDKAAILRQQAEMSDKLDMLEVKVNRAGEEMDRRLEQLAEQLEQQAQQLEQDRAATESLRLQLEQQAQGPSPDIFSALQQAYEASVERISKLEAGLRAAQNAEARREDSDVHLLAGMLGINLAALKQLSAASKASQQGSVHPFWGQAPPSRSLSELQSPRPASLDMSDPLMLEPSAEPVHRSQSEPGTGMKLLQQGESWVLDSDAVDASVLVGSPVPVHPSEDDILGKIKCTRDADVHEATDEGDKQHALRPLDAASPAEPASTAQDPQPVASAAMGVARNGEMQSMQPNTSRVVARRAAGSLQPAAHTGGSATSAGIATSLANPQKAAPMAAQTAGDAASVFQAPLEKQPAATNMRRVSLSSPLERFHRVMAEASRTQAKHDKREASSKLATAEGDHMSHTNGASRARPSGAPQLQHGFRGTVAGCADSAGPPVTEWPASPAAVEATMQLLLHKGGFLEQMRREVGTAQQSLQTSFQAVKGQVQEVHGRVTALSSSVGDQRRAVQHLQSIVPSLVHRAEGLNYADLQASLDESRASQRACLGMERQVINLEHTVKRMHKDLQMVVAKAQEPEQARAAAAILEQLQHKANALTKVVGEHQAKLADLQAGQSSQMVVQSATKMAVAAALKAWREAQAQHERDLLHDRDSFKARAVRFRCLSCNTEVEGTRPLQMGLLQSRQGLLPCPDSMSTGLQHHHAGPQRPPTRSLTEGELGGAHGTSAHLAARPFSQDAVHHAQQYISASKAAIRGPGPEVITLPALKAFDEPSTTSLPGESTPHLDPTTTLTDAASSSEISCEPFNSSAKMVGRVGLDIVSLPPSRGPKTSALPRLPRSKPPSPLQPLQRGFNPAEVMSLQELSFHHGKLDQEAEGMPEGDSNIFGPLPPRPTTAPAQFAATSISPSGGWGTPLPPGRRAGMAEVPSPNAPEGLSVMPGTPSGLPQRKRPTSPTKHSERPQQQPNLLAEPMQIPTHPPSFVVAPRTSASESLGTSAEGPQQPSSEAI
ncbi:hypothetical protein WJX74_002314 [Apatococcus lobatus]|uniref:Uncharacterized protein n=1 Tax=Apatococcus lobatus TaxID=904363 RepID=A0AAW1SE16_9CHLO